MRVEWVTVGALGDPGSRTFHLQARAGDDWVGVVVEKEQVATLADVARRLLARVGAPVSGEELATGALRLAPVVPQTRAVALGLHALWSQRRFVLRVDREPAGVEQLELVLDRDLLATLIADATYALVPVAWDLCRRCRRRLDLDRPHECRG